MATTAEGQQRLVILGYGAYTMEKGGKAQRETPPPRSSQVPHPVLVSCLCPVRPVSRACVPPPPPTPAPPRAGNAGRGGRKATPPPPRTTRQGREAAVGGCRTDHPTVPEEGTRRASPGGGTTGGASAG